MAEVTLNELITAAAGAEGPSFPPPSKIKLGGVDPLGLRQINFDLMDKVLPGLNNVARHIRPFVLVAWAWRRAARLAKEFSGNEVLDDQLVDFVDRIEVIYAWSQLLRDPNVDLPGRQVLAAIVAQDRYVFGGEAWIKRCNERRLSTAFTAPVNYGPGLKALGWVAPHRDHPRVLIALPEIEPALDAFEAEIADRLDHPAFCSFGTVEVTKAEAVDWAEAWAINQVTATERRIAAERFFGTAAPIERRNGGALILQAAAHLADASVGPIRGAMCGPPSNFLPSAELIETSHAWRRVQVRQLLRLGLEAFFYWVMWALEDGPCTSESLVRRFLGEIENRPNAGSAGEWLKPESPAPASPVDLIERLNAALIDKEGRELESTIAVALSLCLTEEASAGERADRLSLERAQNEAIAWVDQPAEDFVQHILESWVLAQHVYWSVGRGLADARARGKSLLRLKVVLEEGGWTLTPGATRGAPIPTPDRLQTAVTLARECGLLNSVLAEEAALG